MRRLQAAAEVGSTPMIKHLLGAWFRFGYLAIIAVIGIGCQDPAPVSLAEPMIMPVKDALTSDLAAELERERFVSQHSARAGAINPNQAKRLAGAWLEHFAPYAQTGLERQRGNPIDLSALEIDSRVLLAQSPYDIDGRELPNPIRNLVGDYYLVSFLEHGEPAIVLAVAATASDVQISNGRIKFPPLTGNVFVPSGVPSHRVSSFPLLPETAATLVSQTAGSRVHASPEFISHGVHFHPALGYWRVRLENGSTAHIDWKGDTPPAAAFQRDTKVLNNRLTEFLPLPVRGDIPGYLLER